eukprot:gene25388-46403_t
MTLSAHSIRNAATAVAGCLLVLMSLAATASAETYKAPRNGFGQPDFSGTWTNASITQLERPPQFKSLTITPAQATMMEQGYARMRSSDAGPTDPNAPAPASGADPGGYNAFWIDPGSK